MTKPTIMEENPIGLAELKEELSKIKKRDDEIGQRALKLEDYLNQFSHLKSKEYQEVIEKLHKLNIPRLKEAHIIKIVDLLPQTMEDLKIILQSLTITITKENLKKIVSITSKIKV